MVHHLRGLDCFSPEDQVLFAKFASGGVRKSRFTCVHHAFEFYAREQPSSIAVEHLGSSITYSELDSKANALAHELRALGIVPGARVCLLVQRSIPMVIGILAVLKAGGQYVPLDGGIVTQSTLDFVLEDSGASVVLALGEFAHRVNASSNRRVLLLEDTIGRISRSRDNYTKPHDLSTPEDGVYVIYTSGSLMQSKRNAVEC